ncbi:MAG: hypothetical protein CL571_03105 [Alphaproteobacteria bacterium]|nr:hypothetical protein [Alphaproteobacteria bacterium]
MQDVSFEKFSEGLKSIFQNNLDNGLSEVDALEGVVDSLAEKLSVMDISKELVNECSEFIIQDYKEGLANGQTPLEAFNSAMESLNLNLEKEILNKNNEGLESNIDLDFAYSGDSPKLDLMNEAMAKGLSVEDAIKYVNNKLNESSDEFGPPTLADFNKINENSVQTAYGKDNQEINKIEATMDAEANKKIPDNTLSDKNIIDDNKILNETNSNNDDEVG